MLNSVSEVKIMAGESSLPANAYVTNDKTEARVGKDIAMALLAARINNNDRMSLQGVSSILPENVQRVDLLHLLSTVAKDPSQERSFPCEELDDFHPRQKLLQ